VQAFPRILGAVVMLGAVLVPPAAARSLRDRLPDAARQVGLEGGSAFDAMADAIADTAARTLPILSTSAGFTYRYNAQLEVFERSSETLGPLFIERPDTLGRGKFNMNVSFQYVDLDEFDGQDLDSLENRDPIVARVVDVTGTPLGFTANRLRYDLSLVNYVYGFSLTYGILDDLDVNLLVPVIATDFDLGVTNRQVAVADASGAFVPQPGPTLAGGSDEATVGVGDVLLRAKYQLPRWEALRSAVGLQLRLPSGDEDDFQGTGTFEASPFLALATVFWDRVEPHAAFALDLNADDVERSQGRYQVGIDGDITRRLGASVAFLGRSEFKRSSPAGETSFLHLTPAGLRQEPLLGLEFDRKDYFDLSFGLRAVVWRQIMVFANGIYALNDDGLRSSSIIPTVGVEGTF
jgi:hypothetical protein